MNKLRTVFVAAIAILTAAITTAVQAADIQPAGCYKPVRGFATSLCTDGESCTKQSGIYKIVLKNSRGATGERTLVMTGLFEGAILTMPNSCGAADAAHVLADRDKVSSITTGPDVACLTGGGDFINTVEVVETLSITGGTGAYSNLVPGGTVTLTGKLGLKTGINKFKVTPMPGDEVCFDYQ
jgi:hypothetical protein